MGPEDEAAATRRVSMMLRTVSAAEGPDEHEVATAVLDEEASSPERQSSSVSSSTGMARRDGRSSFSRFFLTWKEKWNDKMTNFTTSHLRNVCV